MPTISTRPVHPLSTPWAPPSNQPPSIAAHYTSASSSKLSTSLLSLDHNPSEVIQRTKRHTQMPQNAIRTSQMEVEVRDRELSNVALARELELAHGRVQDDLVRLLAVHERGVDAAQQLDGLCDALRELVEGLLLVWELYVLEACQAGGDELGCVAAGVDLVVEAW